MASPKTDPLMEKIVSLCKRKGFVFQSSEIYGGLNSCWDFGPLGVELKRNIKDHWWKTMTHRRDDIEGIDAAILMHPQVWHTSGHVAGFTDPLVDCKECKARFRLDQIEEAMCGNPAYKGRKAEKCQAEGKFTEPRNFNLMFKTFMGPVEEDAATVYMRPETAQGIYVNFLNVMGPMRRRPPFGIAQIGKAFRNEISPGNFIFRSREFEQMEMQYFIDPKEDQKWFEYWKEERLKFYLDLGIHKERLRFHQHGPGELAHYAKDAYDIEYEFPFGWREFEGIHNRTDFDLSRHKEASGVDLSYFDEETKQRYVPYIIETSAGADRTTLVCLVDGYKEEEVKGEKRVSISLDPRIAPIKVAIFPLVNRDGMPEVAMNITNDLRTKFKVFYDDKGAVGRRYRRMDEVGTPYCVTVDTQTLQDQTVTIRHRDSMEQERMNMANLAEFFEKRVLI